MPAAIGLVAAVGGAVVASSGTVIGVLGTLGATLVGTAISIGGAFVASMLSRPKVPRIDTLTATGGGAFVNGASGVEPHQWVYGRTRVGGARLFAAVNGPSNQYVHLIIALAGHECDAVETIYLDDEAIDLSGLDGTGNVTSGPFSGVARLRVHLGGVDQAADEKLVAEGVGWTAEHRLRGICYVYVWLAYNADVFVGGVPSVSAVVRGRKVLDPRTGLTAWSDNWALCVRDFLAEFGEAEAAEIDDAAMVAAANVADELVDLEGGGTQKRYTANGALTLDPDDWLAPLEALVDAGAGLLTYTGGTYRLFGGAYVEPELEVDATWLRGEVEVIADQPRAERFNALQAVYRDPEEAWQATTSVEVSGSGFVAADGGRVIRREIELPWTPNAAAAERLCRLRLERHRQATTVQMELNLSGMALQVGRTFSLTIPHLGFDGKVFRVVGWQMQPDFGGVDVTGVEDAPGVYAWDGDTTVDYAPATVLPSARIVQPPRSVRIVDDAVLAGGATAVRLLVQWDTALDASVVAYDVEVRPAGGATWRSLGTTSGTQSSAWDAAPGAYEARVRARNGRGVTSAWATATGQALGWLQPPGDVAGLRLSVLGAVATLTWPPVTGPLVAGYQVRYSPALSGATWGTAVPLLGDVTATSAQVAALSGSYLVKAVSVAGVVSAEAALAVSRAGDISALNAVETVAEGPGFAGAKAAVVLDGDLGGLVVDLAEAAEGVYSFATAVDLEAVYTSRVSARVSASGVDTLDDLFDRADWFGMPEWFAVDPAAWDVVMEVRTTDDDPGGTPVWSDWDRLVVGDLTARALEFRARLVSQADGVTPLVTALSVDVDMPDRIISGDDVAVGTGGVSIAFAPPYLGFAGVAVSGQDMATGDYVEVTAKGPGGFDVLFRNAAGTPVARTMDYVAVGWGYRIT